MGTFLRLLIADRNEADLQKARKAIRGLGHSILAEVASGEALIDTAILLRPDLIVTEIELDGSDGLEALRKLTPHFLAPAIVLSHRADHTSIERASACPVQAYLLKPLNSPSLDAAIAVSMHRFLELQSLKGEVESAQRRIADHAIVERAKGVLMKRASIDELAAYQRIRSMARNTGQTLGQIARAILMTESAFKEMNPQGNAVNAYVALKWNEPETHEISRSSSQ